MVSNVLDDPVNSPASAGRPVPSRRTAYDGASSLGGRHAGPELGDLARGLPGSWVLLSYRLPREPSTPRISVWRKLKRLGVAQISDGLVALPADARTQEQLEWIAEEITDAGGTATVWVGRPTALAEEHHLAQSMAERRAAEYRAVIAEARRGELRPDADRLRLIRRLRAEVGRIHRRDYFPPPERRAAEAAVDALRPGRRRGETA